MSQYTDELALLLEDADAERAKLLVRVAKLHEKSISQATKAFREIAKDDKCATRVNGLIPLVSLTKTLEDIIATLNELYQNGKTLDAAEDPPGLAGQAGEA